MTNIIIGGALAIVGIIGLIVLWIMAIVKAFQAKETVWGILSIVFGILVGTIFFFVKGHTKLGVWCIVCFLLYVVGAGFAAYTLQANPELMEQFEGMQQGTPAPAEG